MLFTTDIDWYSVPNFLLKTKKQYPVGPFGEENLAVPESIDVSQGFFAQLDLALNDVHRPSQERLQLEFQFAMIRRPVAGYCHLKARSLTINFSKQDKLVSISVSKQIFLKYDSCIGAQKWVIQYEIEPVTWRTEVHCSHPKAIQYSKDQLGRDQSIKCQHKPVHPTP